MMAISDLAIFCLVLPINNHNKKKLGCRKKKEKEKKNKREMLRRAEVVRKISPKDSKNNGRDRF
jgi:hypothetical protein